MPDEKIEDPFEEIVEVSDPEDEPVEDIDPQAATLFKKVKSWGLVVSAIGGLVTGLGGIIGGVSGWFRQPQDNQPVKEAYEVLSEQIEKLNYGVQQNHEDIVALSNWLDGYVTFADRSYAPKKSAVPIPSALATGRRPAPVPTAAPTATAVASAGPGAGGNRDGDGVGAIQDALPAPEAPPPVEPPAPESFAW